MLPLPGETEAVLDTEQTIKELLVTDEDLALAWNASRSFTVRKNRFFQDQEVYFGSEISNARLNDIEVCIPQKTPKFTCESPKPKEGESNRSITFPSTLSGFHTRSNKVHLHWKDQNFKSLNGNDFTFEVHNTIKANEEKIKSDDTEEDIDIFQHMGSSHEKRNARKEKIKEYVESVTFNVIVGIFTVFALLSNDIGSLIDSRTVDTVFDVIALLSFFVFAGEMLLALYVEDHYKWSLFFWLDLFSTLSILIHVEFLLEDFFPEIVHKSAGIAEASRASRLVTREGAIIRLIQVFQIGRLYKHITRNQTLTEMNHRKDVLQKTYSSKLVLESKKSLSHPSQQIHKNRQSVSTLQKLKSVIVDTFGRLPTIKAEPSLQNLDPSIQKIDPLTKEAETTAALYRERKKSKDQDIEVTFKDVEEENLKETRIAKKLSDYTMKHIIVLVMALLLIIPLFESTFYFEPHSSQEYQMKLLQVLIDDPNISQNTKEQAISFFIKVQKEHDPHLVYFKLGNDILFSDPNVDVSHLKHSQSETVSITTYTKSEMISIVSFHTEEKREAILAIVNTIFICFVLTCGAILLNHDAQRLVLKPLEKIINRVNSILRNPASAREPEKIPKDNSAFKTTACMVEHAIIRMSELLAIGFGDTGSAVITQNFIMSGDLTSSLIGKKKVAIFGVCDIHDFIETTEVLQEETLLFVNTIAHIVHSMTDKYTGTVSQNMGDAFLLVWKFPEDSIVENEDGRLEIVLNQVTQNIADCSLIAFMKIYARINRDPTLLKYKRDMRLKSRLPNYRLKMGFGLHVGWAIEGAIGSEHKIDSYYLSPDVNMAGRLEAGTRQYDVPLLFSDDLYGMLSDKMKNESRLIDEVEVEGLDHHLKLYTVDMSIIGLRIAKDRRYLPRRETKQRQKKKKEYVKDIIQNGYAYTLLHTDRDLKNILRNGDSDFERYFEVGFKAYVNGDWICAKQNFEKCCAIKYDGPTNELLNYIKLYGCSVPEGWERRKVILKK